MTQTLEELLAELCREGLEVRLTPRETGMTVILTGGDAWRASRSTVCEDTAELAETLRGLRERL